MKCWRTFETVFGAASLLFSYSLALDESTDVSDTAQLAVFIRGIDSKFTIYCAFIFRLLKLHFSGRRRRITEELLPLVPMKCTTGNNNNNNNGYF